MERVQGWRQGWSPCHRDEKERDPLAGWVFRLGPREPGGGRAACKVSSALLTGPCIPPLAPKRSISPWLTCETQGWEPLCCSVTKIKIYRDMTGLEVFMTCTAPIPPANLFVPGGAGVVYDCQHHSICSGACDADSGDKMSNPVRAPRRDYRFRTWGHGAALPEKDPGLTPGSACGDEIQAALTVCELSVLQPPSSWLFYLHGGSHIRVETEVFLPVNRSFDISTKAS